MTIATYDNPLLAGVIGNPISHSKSPKLHNYWLNKYGIDGYYIPIAVHPTKLKLTIDSLITLGFRGINVTMPYKSLVLTFADIITDRASVIGAANTLYFSPSGKITADNTDGYGFITNLHQGAPDWKPDAGPAVVLGAGGACRLAPFSFVWPLEASRGPDELQSGFSECPQSDIFVIDHFWPGWTLPTCSSMP